MSDTVKNQEIKGSVTFANEVLETIAGLAACDIPGVAGMSGGFKDGIVDFLGRKNLTKGVKVTLDDQKVSVDVQVVLEYGVCAPEVCGAIQTAVIRNLETMTGLTVKSVNVFVQGVKVKEPEALPEA